MQFQEFKPTPYFSHHVECFWEMQFTPGELDSPFELLSPDCTFDLIFSALPLYLKMNLGQNWKYLHPGATVIGQKTSGIQFGVQQPIRIFGIRFKPFGLSKVLSIPLHQLNDEVASITALLNCSKSMLEIIKQVLKSTCIEEQLVLAESFLIQMLEKTYAIDETLRAQTNYILTRKGNVKINALFQEFGISKAALHQSFVRKLGITPKKVSRIWRMNYFLELHESFPQRKLTALCLEAGFYDQAHFIKEFRSFFGISPRQFLRQESQLLQISKAAITRRFTNQYDPK